MGQARPYMRDSVKNLEKVLTDYAFNKKVLTAVRAELLLRTTKGAAALLQKVQQRLEEIEKRDRFGKMEAVKATPPVTPSQLPLIEKPVAKPIRVAHPSTPPPTPRSQLIIVNNPAKVAAPPPAEQDTQAKVKSSRGVSGSSIFFIAIFAVIALFSGGRKIYTTMEAVGRLPAPISRPAPPSRTTGTTPQPTTENLQKEYEALMGEVDRAHDKRGKKVFEDSSSVPAPQRSMYPEAAKPTDPSTLKERLDGYRDTVDALLH